MRAQNDSASCSSRNLLSKSAPMAHPIPAPLIVCHASDAYLAIIIAVVVVAVSIVPDVFDALNQLEFLSFQSLP